MQQDQYKTTYFPKNYFPILCKQSISAVQELRKVEELFVKGL